MRILVDAMGGDLAPDEIVKGAVHAQQELGAEIVLVGQRAAIEACLRNEQAKLEIIDASEVITMDDDPSTATRRKKDASMTVALNMLRDGKGDAVVSAGSTGALLADCTPEYLLQFAYMGSYYARTMLGIAAPRVGLLSNGTEEHKGSELQHETFPLLKAADAAGRIRFVGNVEASQVFSGDVDVVVTDGFTGNVLLKGIEGSIKYMTRQLKGIFMKNFKTKMAALAIKDEFHALKASLDPNEVGGTAMLGISKPVIKAHGSSDARAIYNAIRQAIAFADSGIIDDITANISYMRVDKHAAKESD